MFLHIIWFFIYLFIFVLYINDDGVIFTPFELWLEKENGKRKHGLEKINCSFV